MNTTENEHDDSCQAEMPREAFGEDNTRPLTIVWSPLLDGQSPGRNQWFG